MSTMSSKNDELLLLIYKKQEVDKILEAPVCISEFVLDTLKRENKIDNLQLSNNTYLILLFELDEERPVEQIDPVIRIFWSTILLLHSKKDRAGLMKYLHDNDLLGYYEVKIDKQFMARELELNGRQNMDYFHYKLKLTIQK